MVLDEAAGTSISDRITALLSSIEDLEGGSFSFVVAQGVRLVTSCAIMRHFEVQ